jgi:cellulose synthase/poly-beta-1,6-N-acetylglucosamine synthase-like glycosyltransferase
MSLLLFTLSLLFLGLALHPFVTYPLSLRLLRGRFARPLQPVAAGKPLTYAICVCAYNEANVIAAKAENLMALKRAIPGLEIFIYVDAASDGTAEILKEWAQEFTLHVSPERHGKSYGMNLLVGMAKADIIIFSDANVMLDVTSVPALSRYFADPEVGCVCGHLIYLDDEDTTGQTAANGSLYWRLEEYIKQLEHETGSVMGADGSIFAVRRRLHCPPPADIIDDMFVSFSILCGGSRIVRAPDVIAYERSATVAREEFRRKVRIACQAFNVHRLMWPQLKKLPPFDLYKYVSHKLIRWFVLYWLVLAGLFFEAGLLVAGCNWLAVLLPLLGGAGLVLGIRFNIKPVPQLVDILYAFAGTALGVWRSVMGDRFQTWAPAQSVRKTP